mmetsp:Transcript_81211/g.161060  ORF Transcript_81211/g.161060 Transcript_81211/m.161060 type:complete len:356 (+) Transcript_81211:91-1158(+)
MRRGLLLPWRVQSRWVHRQPSALASARLFGVAASHSTGTRGTVFYQGESVPTSIVSTGRVGTYRDGLGSDGTFFGVDPQPVEVQVSNGRGLQLSLDEQGFRLVDHSWSHIDYYDEQAILSHYYPECESLVCQETGASWALAFDHNIRSRRRKAAGEALKGGNAVQEPLLSYGVHNDYTATSAPMRIRQFAQPPKHNDTIRQLYGSTPPISPERTETLLKGRWQFINVWRNIASEPVQRLPLGLCDASSTDVNDLVVFEIRYSDRVGENYFARHSTRHRWFYFPEATRNEAVLLKCWDSRGKGFMDLMPGQEEQSDINFKVPATFSLHSAFEETASPAEAPDRESIEVRVVAFFEE